MTTASLQNRLRALLVDYLGEYGPCGYNSETFVDFVVAHAVLTHGGIDGLFSFYQKRIDALRALRRAPKKPFPGTFLPVARIARNGATRELYVYGVLTRVVDITYDATKSLQDDADKINAAAAATAQDDEAPNTLIIRAKGVDLAGLEKTLRSVFGQPKVRKSKSTKKVLRSR